MIERKRAGAGTGTGAGADGYRGGPRAGLVPRLMVMATCACAWALAASASLAQTVSLSGSFGDKALLVIDGTPRSVAVGNTVKGVRLVSVTGSDALVEVGGKRVTLALGGSQINLGGGASEGGGGRIVLSAQSGGHFFTAGSINGKAVRFLVDTGATNVALGEAEADRLGLDWRTGTRSFSGTANGAVNIHRITLGAVRVGEVTVYNVDASVLPAQLGIVLLGNSYLSRFQMKRENDTLTLDKRF